MGERITLWHNTENQEPPLCVPNTTAVIETDDESEHFPCQNKDECPNKECDGVIKAEKPLSLQDLSWLEEWENGEG